MILSFIIKSILYLIRIIWGHELAPKESPLAQMYSQVGGLTRGDTLRWGHDTVRPSTCTAAKSD